MRRPRLVAPAHFDAGYYHCVSRVVDRRFVLDAQAKEHFIRLMRVYEKFGHVRVLAYCVMCNHFHILVEVPRRPECADLPDDVALVGHVRNTLGDKSANELQWQLELLRGRNDHAAAQRVRERLLRRMWSLSAFMKVLKQRFSQWFNPRHKRCGTLWEDRFHSSLVEGQCHALQAIAAYIELNPVRARMVEDPKDYRFCSHAEAVAGAGLASSAVQWLMGIGHRDETTQLSAKDALTQFRRILFGVEGSPQAGLDPKKVAQVLQLGGKLPLSSYLHCRTRYFTDGVVLGSREFVETIFREAREQFSTQRKTAARALRGLEAAGDAAIFTCRELRVRLFG